VESIGDRIKKLRKSLNLTQSQLGELIGKSKGNISGYENGTFEPSANTIVELAKCFNISTDELLLGYSIENSDFLSKADEDLVKNFNKLDNVKKERILERIDTYLEDETDITGIHADKSILRVSGNQHLIKYIPILGQTSAYNNIEIIEIGGGNYIAVPKSLDIDYAFFLKDDSMAPIMNAGDLIFVKYILEIENGTIAAINIDGSIDCRKILMSSDMIELIPLNKNYDTTVVNQSEKTFRIIGKVIICRNTASNFFVV